MPKKQHTFSLDSEHRLRSTIETRSGEVLHWAIQLEWLDPELDWTWVARYDTSGGTVHLDRNRIAAHEPVTWSVHGGEAARLATEDFKLRAEEYTRAYLAAKAAGRSAW